MRHDDAFADVVDEARRDDPQAWGRIYDAVTPILYGYLRAQSLRDPDDVAGEVLLEVVRDIHRFEGDERAFRSWVLAIARHRMIDARRAAGRRPTDPVPAEDLDVLTADDAPVDRVVAAEGWSRLTAELDTLTDEQRDVVLLRVVGDLSLQETAAVMDRTVGAVKALQHRAHRALRARLRATRNPEQAADATQV